MKKYTIQDKDFTLSEVTPRRLRDYCELIGIKSFSELSKPETIVALNKQSLEISLDVAKVQKVLETCLVEDVSTLSFEDISINKMNEIFNDFFSQLFWKSDRPENA